ncbi:MAG: 6-bladed beta-propeller [Gemmatimonadetes bacterium]|nr:6-bladed beta-propeller [Gemmatimonadota bacterium]
MMPSPRLLFLAVPLVGACDRPPPPSDSTGPDSTLEAPFTVQDSAGVEIVVNHVPQRPLGQFWTFDPEPAFVLGEDKSNLAGEDAPGIDAQDPSSGAIWRVRGLARLEDGRIAVLSSGNGQLYIFEASGKLSRTIGRRGRGPGEFSRPQHLRYLPPDTLVVWDEWMGPVTYFDTAGTVLSRRTIDLGRALEELPDEAGVESRTVPLPDGSFVVEVEFRDPDFERPPEDALVRYPPVEYVRLDEAYAAISFGSWEGRERWVVPKRLRGISPLAASLLAARDHLFSTSILDSRIAAGGRPASIYISDGGTNEIRQFSLDGTLVRIIRRTTRPVRVTERAHQAWRQNSIRVLVTVNQGGDWMPPLIEAQPRREYYPPVAGLFVDAEGYLWVKEWSDAETGLPDQWSIFSPQGRWLGVLDGPPNPTGLPDFALCNLPCWAGRGFFVALRRDEWGVERVEGFRIRY